LWKRGEMMPKDGGKVGVRGACRAHGVNGIERGDAKAGGRRGTHFEHHTRDHKLF
jgi:hypothetical protein